ncbi:MAG: hypothetical protein IT416_01400 [Candidatus Pacebacteria bacterium]|nr:hypothetical protein [Candidatus Paceibacterota bacterium]
MEFIDKVRKKLAEIDQKAQEAGEATGRRLIKDYLFARNAPKNSLEAKLLDQLVQAQEEYLAIPFYEFRKKKLARQKLDQAAEKALQAHHNFLARGEKYVTRRGKIIE